MIKHHDPGKVQIAEPPKKEIRGGGGQWGFILGTLTNQADLVAALAEKAGVADNETITGSWTFNDSVLMFDAQPIYFRSTQSYIYSEGAGTITLVGATSVDMVSNAVIIGKNTDEDISLTFNAASADGVVTWMEDEDYFKFSDCIRTEGGRKISVVAKTTTYTALVPDELIVCNSTTAFTLTLPVASGSGQRYYIKNINTGAVTVDGDTGDTVDGVANAILGQWDSIIVVDYAANKWVIL